MDIVSVKKSEQLRVRAARRLSERRHTTEVRYDQLPSHTLSELERDSITSLSTEDLSPRGEDYHHPVADYTGSSMPNGQLYEPGWSSSSAHHSVSSSRDSTDSYFMGSQGDIFQELTEHAQYGQGGRVGREALEVPGHQYQLSYELALDNVLTPFAPPAPIISPLARTSNAMSQSHKPSHINHVVEEMVTTEMTYVHDLSEVVEGYLMPLQMRVNTLPLSSQQVNSLFGNVSRIRDFHSSFLKCLNESNANISKVGLCFLDKVDGFKDVYTEYCNNYPKSVQVLSELSKQPEVSRILKTCQQRLNHLLPLGAYLLKPVQRVLKYALLLSSMLKGLHDNVPGYMLVKDAAVEMAEVAEHINAMKRKYDTAVHVQEIQSLMRGHEMQQFDLTKYGDLVLEDNFRYSSSKGPGTTFRNRAERYVFLFERLCLVTKKEEDGYQYKTHVELKDLQLTERIEKEPNVFQIRQVSTGRSSTFQARSHQQKEEWVQKIKVLLMESIPHLPDRARELIMRGFEVPRDPSPSRERHRHVTTDELKSSRGEMDLTASKRASSLGRNSTPQMMMQYANLPSRDTKVHAHGRHMSAPPTKLQASLTGLMVSSVHHPSLSEDILESREPNDGFHDQRDSGYSDNGDPLKTRTEGEGAKIEGEANWTPNSSRKMFSHLDHARATPDKDHTPSPGLSAVSISSPSGTPPYRKSPVAPHAGFGHVTNQNGHVTKQNGHMTKQNGHVTENHSTDVNDHITHNNTGHAHPNDDHTQTSDDHSTSSDNHAHSGDDHAPNDVVPITTEEETLFNELMEGGSLVPQMNSTRDSLYTELVKEFDDPSTRAYLTQDRIQQLDESSTPRPTHKPRPPQSGDSSDENHNRVESSIDEGSTPQASPYSTPSNIRRWSVKKRRSYDFHEDDSTPKASPFIRRHLSASAQGLALSESQTFDDLSSPILDPPTPFRTPILNQSLEEHPEEALGHDDLIPCPGSDQDRASGGSSRGSSRRTSPSPVNQDGLSSASGHRNSRDSISSAGRPSRKSSSAGQDASPNLSEVTKEEMESSNTRLFTKARTVPPELVMASTTESKRPMTPEVVPTGSHRRGSSSAAVKRSKSFGIKTKVAVHLREGSLSTDNSPLPSPIFQARQMGRGKDIARYSTNNTRHAHHASTPSASGGKGSPAPTVSVMGLISTTRTTPELQDIPLIQVDPMLVRTSPVCGSGGPMAVAGSGDEGLNLNGSYLAERSESRNSSVPREGGETDSLRDETEHDRPHEERSLFSFLRRNKRGSRSATPTHEISPPMPDVSGDGSRYEPDVEMTRNPALFLQPVTPSSATPLFSPLDSHSDDIISFEDCLETYDKYASASGRTSRSARLVAEAEALAQSPAAKKKEKKEKKKKKKRHGHTVANIDAETIREAKKLAERGRKTSDSKVTKLAREYSQRIKDLNRVSRVSTLYEESFVPPSPTPVKPVWLVELRERRNSRGKDLEYMLHGNGGDDFEADDASSVNSNSNDDASSSGTRPLPRPCSDNNILSTAQTGQQRGDLFEGAEFQEGANEGEAQKGKRFRGWVRSIAARFGRKSDGTTL